MKKEVDREFELLRNCASTQLSPKNVEAIRTLVRKDVRWDALIQLAEYHRIRPLLYKSLREGFESYIPPTQAELLETLNRSSTAHGVFLVREFGRLLNMFSKNGIPAIAFKGPILAHASYGSINLRTFVDMDILVRKNDFYATKDLLLSEGYLPDKAITNLSPFQEKIYLWQDNQYPVARGPGVFKVDLHTEIMPPLYTFNIDFNEFWGRSEQIEIEGYRFNTFHPEDRLVILCFHGIKNRWVGLRYICDVAETIGSNPDIDWSVILSRSQTAKCERILLLGLCLASKVLDVAIPNIIDDAIKQIREISLNATRIIKRLKYLTKIGPMSLKERSHLQLALQDNMTGKIRYSTNAMLRRISDYFLYVRSGL